LPGDRLQMRGGRLYLNDQPVERQRIEDYVARDEASGQLVRKPRFVETLPGGRKHEILEVSDNEPLDNTPVFTVPENHFFAMGDNRDNSLDSRVAPNSPLRGVGFIPRENLVGRAEFLFFSTDGSAAIWEFWKWPGAIRFHRFFNAVR
jgi:signal peptidase I